MLPLWGYDNQGIRAATDTCLGPSSPNHVAIQLTAVQGSRNYDLPLGSTATKASALAKRWVNTSLMHISVASQSSRQELPACTVIGEDPMLFRPLVRQFIDRHRHRLLAQVCSAASAGYGQNL